MSASPRHLVRAAVGLLTIVMTIPLALTLGGCDPSKFGKNGEDAGAMQEPEERPTPVLIATLERGTIQGQIRAASTIEAELQVTVHAESVGRITSLVLEEGDTIEAGQVLARIRREAQSLGVERAETNLADAERELARVEALFRQGIASQSELDQARTRVDTASLDKRDRRRDLSNTVIVAPFSGVLTRRFVDEGAFVANGAQVFEITDFSTLVARVYVPERELDRIAVGQPAQIVGKAAKNRQGTGSVRRIAPVVDATTGTVKITIALPTELAGGSNGFLPGMYAEVTLTTERHENVPLVPKPALIHEDEQTFVFIADGDRARRVLIQTGLADDDFVEVIGGLDVGARIIVAGQTGLKDGGLLLEVDAKGQPVATPETAASATQEAVAKAG
jgi:membrane fusion protein (multidrug efflux system)